MYEATKPARLEGVELHELRELQIIKQSVVESLMKSGAIKERTKEAEKLILDWVSFIRRNGKAEKDAYYPLPF